MTKQMFLAVAILMVSARCATVAHGRYQQIPVNSTPAGAAVSVDCGNGIQNAGVTPVTVNLKRNADKCAVSLSREGYEDASATFAKTISVGSGAISSSAEFRDGSSTPPTERCTTAFPRASRST